MSGAISGGVNIAMKVPTHHYDSVVAFYRDVLGLAEIDGKGDVSFQFGPNRLWIDHVPQLSQPEVWLELVTDGFEAAAIRLHDAGVMRNDGIEPLPETMRAGWFFNPAGIVHLLRQTN